ncbi:MAG: hypothetical protein IT557_12185 [Alphaproteobacteria bacterium]|nr:hypothetical protein [Alphaproteobacteria bacterium]
MAALAPMPKRAAALTAAMGDDAPARARLPPSAEGRTTWSSAQHPVQRSRIPGADPARRPEAAAMPRRAIRAADQGLARVMAEAEAALRARRGLV